MSGQEYHVSLTGNDGWEGSLTSPFRTISEAASKAQPGDVITVHEGTYRERVNPQRGGESDTNRIVYQAAAGERVEIKGSEIIKDWEQVQGDVWKATIPNSFFQGFNPFDDLIQGDWFDPKGRDHHTGAVYLNGEWLIEAAELHDVLHNEGNTQLWFARVDEQNTTIWANFGSSNPNVEMVEVNARQSVFYPEQPGINYITVRGFMMRHAATPWAPPTAEQIALIGTHWSKGWIIENNVISHSRCTGISLGKYGDEWDNVASTADAYNKTIERALENGWNREQVGHHIVRGNTISHCEMAGIVGSLGACFSVITENVVHDIHVQRFFSGAEMAGIKFHGAIDTLVSKNHIFRTVVGLWFDWMTQGTRVSRNLLHDNVTNDLFVEVNHGPFMVDHNLFLSANSADMVFNVSQGGAYVHNLFMGAVCALPELTRSTPYHRAHSTDLAGLHAIEGGDDRLYNNLFVDHENQIGLSKYDTAAYPVFMDGNVFLNGAKPSIHEAAPLIAEQCDPDIQLVIEEDAAYLHLTCDMDWKNQRSRKLVTTSLLDQSRISGLPYEDTDGKPFRMNTDYFGHVRDENNPYPGPFEMTGDGRQVIKVWPNT
ncbi:right-handed parallel beta-helix repeat-containing protein [Paenibacillus marinisediminis]